MALSHIDIKFFKLAVGSTSLGKVSEADVTCRCPVCGDSQKKRNAKRLHLYQKGDVTQVNCFNGDCAVHNKTMWSFLRDFYPELLTQYKRETFSKNMSELKGESLGSLVTKQEPAVKPEKPVLTQDLSSFMTPLKDADDGIVYLRNRGIGYRPTKFGQWYYGNQDLKIGETLYKLKGSIIVPLYCDGEMYGFYSRSTKEKNFITYMNDANIGYKVAFWFDINKNEDLYIYEGVFDALSMNHLNVIALLGAKLPEDRLKELTNPIFVLDNDRTGILNMIHYAERGYKVFVQPSEYKEKDMNELMLHHPELDMKEMIDKNIYSGVSATIRLKSKL